MKGWPWHRAQEDRAIMTGEGAAITRDVQRLKREGERAGSGGCTGRAEAKGSSLVFGLHLMWLLTEEK